LPDFCNLGVWLRALLGANGLMLLGALARNRNLPALPSELVELAALVEPVVLSGLLCLCLVGNRLTALPTLAGSALATALIAVLGAVWAALLGVFATEGNGPIWRAGFWSALGAATLLVWFDLAARARSPAVAEARLMALTARIRPHFLFNCLNGVLGVIRSDPRRAETALEALADLFRALMRDNRELVPLSDEISLSRQYLDLERLRLGARLKVRWDVDTCPPDASIPPLLLQPLLENAVYHGVEPLDEPGEIAIQISFRTNRLRIEITNPRSLAEGHSAGNKMALANIRERLLLFFDLEAHLDIQTDADNYRVSISLPYRKTGGS
jgi:two-component system sensor histidine kinase AlgZ